MEKLSFFTPVSFSHFPTVTKKQRFIQAIDDYFYLKGKKAFAIDAPMLNGSQPVIIGECSRSKGEWIVQVVKVISYVTLVFPLIALIAKATLRTLQKFHIHQFPQHPLPVKLNPQAAAPLQISSPIPAKPPLAPNQPNPAPQAKVPSRPIPAAPVKENILIPPAPPPPVPVLLPQPAAPQACQQAPVPPIVPHFQRSPAVPHNPAVIHDHKGKRPMPEGMRQAAQDLKEKFLAPKKYLDEIQNRNIRAEDIKAIMDYGIAIHGSGNALLNHLESFKGESNTVKQTQRMLKKLLPKIEAGKKFIEDYKLGGLKNGYMTDFLILGAIKVLGDKKAMIDDCHEIIQSSVLCMDAIIHYPPNGVR